MNVASLKLCKELYELSGWEPEGHDYYCEYQGQTVNTAAKVGEYICPAYDLGYLLRKLPQNYGRITLKHREASGVWFCKWDDRKAELGEEALTPEDAVAKLCIKFFHEGLFQKEAA